MKLLKSKKAQEFMVEYIVAVMVIMVLWLVLVIGSSIDPDTFSKPTIKGEINVPNSYGACDKDLTNLMKFTSEEGVSFAEFIAFAEVNGSLKEGLENQIVGVMDEYTSKLSDAGSYVQWYFAARSGTELIVSANQFFVSKPEEVCSQLIPSLNPEKIIEVKLQVGEIVNE